MAAIVTMKNKFIAPLNVFSCAGTADLGLVNLASNPVGFPHQHKTVSPQSVRVVGGDKRLWKCPGKGNTTRYCRGKEEEEGWRKRKSETVSTLHSRLVRKRGLKSSGAESSVRARDQDFSEARDRASISARGI